MKMIVVVCPQERHAEFRDSLQEHGVHAYTEMRHVVGQGETGKKFGTRIWPEESILILMVVDDDRKAQLLELVRHCQSRLYPAEGMRAFVMPVEEIL